MSCSTVRRCFLAITILAIVLSLAPAQFLKKASNRTNVVSGLLQISYYFKYLSHIKALIGHIGAIGALPNYDKILDLSRRELLEDGTLGDDFDIE